jgi:hypothetical protein
MREHGGVTLSTRDKSSSHHVAVALLQQQQPNGHGKQLLQLQHADSPRTPRRPSDGCSSWRARLLSRKLVALWLLGLGLASCFAIRHGTRLLDAAGQQHHLLHLQPHGFGKHAEASIAAAAAAGAAAATQRQSASASSSGTAAAGNASSSPAAVLVAQRAKWPDGYVAVCAVVKDQWPDLRYWIEYHRCGGVEVVVLLLGSQPLAARQQLPHSLACHVASRCGADPASNALAAAAAAAAAAAGTYCRWLGVSKFYIYDNNSTLPSLLQLWDYLQDGTVEYQYFLGEAGAWVSISFASAAGLLSGRAEAYLTCVSVPCCNRHLKTNNRPAAAEARLHRHQPVPRVPELPAAALQTAPLDGVH